MRFPIEMVGRLLLPMGILAAVSLFKAAKVAIRRWGTGSPRDWPTASARIEVVSVVEEVREGRYGSADTTGYAANLTYFYRNPELQMGEYRKTFPLENAAQRWAEGFKNREVVVHVNPKDATDSILLKTDLEALSLGAAPSLAEAVRMEDLPRLEHRYMVLSGGSEAAALAGLSMTVVALTMRLNHGSFAWPFWMKVTVGVLVAFCFASAWVVSYRADDSNRLQAMLLSSTLFCPSWMRWAVRISGALLFVLWFVANVVGVLPAEVQRRLAMSAPFWPYLFLCWGFLSTAATHTALLRSQETAGRLSVEAAEHSARSSK